jgi:hypothetical protein
MPFYKFRVVLVLLLVVVPAGCLPWMTAGAAVSEAQAVRRPSLGPGPARGLTGAAVVGIGVALLLAVWANLRLVKLVRRAGAAQAAGDDWPFGLSPGATWTLIGTAYGLGLICGVYFLVLLSTV